MEMVKISVYWKFLLFLVYEEVTSLNWLHKEKRYKVIWRVAEETFLKVENWGS